MADVILREKTDGLLCGLTCTWVTEWHCQPPPGDVPYSVHREEWTHDENGIVRRVFEISYKPLQVVMHGE